MRNAGSEVRLSGSLDGGITVFLSLILTCICALLGGLYESARLAGGGWYLQMALNSSLDSLMSCYHREAWEKYRLFLLEYGTEADLEKEVEACCSAYLEEAPYYGLEPGQMEVSVSAGITDEDGIYLEQQILDYMEFGIWGMEDTKTISEFAENLREAESFQKIAGRYQDHGTEILSLEKSLDRLGECLKKQTEYLRDGKKALGHCNGAAFFREAEHLKKELERIPGLVEAYEKEADRLKEQIEESEAAAELLKEDLKAGTWGMAAEEMEEYRSYLEEEGSRRKEVRAVQVQAEANLQVLERAVLEAEAVQEYIDAWEEDREEDSGDEDSEEDELDEEALWQQVTEILEDFREDSRFQKSGIQEKQKLSVLELVSRRRGTDLLDICVPEDVRISAAVLSGKDLPSEMPGQGNDNAGDLFRRALLAEYTARYFGCFLSEEEKFSGDEGREGGTGVKPFSYEQEYILCGSLSDRKNLTSVVHRLLAVREAVNLLALMGDSSLRAEAEALAAAITGAAFGPLTGVVTLFIMTVWAFAESVEDVKILLRGGKLSFFKTANQWKVSLSGLAEQGTDIWNEIGAGSGQTEVSSGQGGEISEEAGLDYQAFLKLFRLLQDKVQARYRIMDMIQTFLQREQADFLMKQCAFRLEAEFTCEGPLVPVQRRSVQEY